MFKKLSLAALCSIVCASCFAAAPIYTMRIALPKAADSAVTPANPSAPSGVRAWAVPQSYSDTFDSVLIGASSQLMLELTNSGTGADTLSSPSFTGSADFAVSSSTCTAVPVNGTCRLALKFTPTSENPQQATLNLAGKAVQYWGTGLRAPAVTSAMLMHMNGTAGTTGFSDAYGTSVTNVGGVQVTSAAKFGTGAARFNGSNQGLVFSNEAFNFGSADYTVEAWVKPRAGNSSLQSVISNSWGWQLYWGNGAFSFYVSANPSGPGYYNGMPMNSEAGSAPAEAWSHVAVVRNGASLKLYVNGSLASSVPFTASQVAPLYPASLGVIYASNTAALSYYFGGDIDEFRITKNFARYTTNFTPDSKEFAN